MHRDRPASPPRPARRLRLLLLPLVGVAFLELTGQVLLRLKPEWVRPPAHWADADAFADHPWVDAYFREWWESYQVRWQSYTYWRRLPYQGEYIGVDPDGVRRSWQAETAGGAAAPATVCMLGGSTLWGFGARDEYTIPSHLARALADAGVSARVHNLGETGYVSTQGLLTLMRRLQQNDIPDLVICYDGINDVFASYQAGEAGIPQNEYRRAKEFNLLADDSGRTGYLVALAGYRVVARSALVRWTESLARSVRPPVLPGSYAPALPNRNVTRRLAEETAAAYLANVRMLSALADRFGFDLLCIWQPTLFTKPQRSAYEAAQAEAFDYLSDLYLLTTEAVREGGGPLLDQTLLLLTDVFADTADPVYLDFCHISEAGNGMVVQAMLPAVTRRLRALPPSPP